MHNDSNVIKYNNNKLDKDIIISNGKKILLK